MPDPTKYAPYESPQAAAADLGTPLSQRLQPDFSVAVPSRIVTREESLARKWSWYRDASACRRGHQAAKRTSNPGICSDCLREDKGEPTVYPRSKAQKFYNKTPKAADGSTSTAAPAQNELTKSEQSLLTALAEQHDIDKACAAVGWGRAQYEARYSSSETFRKAVDDLLDRNQIPRTLKTPKTFAWTYEVKRSLVRHLVDGGLLHSAIEAVGASPSSYYDQLDSDPEFAAMIETARPLALATLKERSLFAASTGNDRLLKILSDGTEDDTSFSNMSPAQLDAELRRLIERFDAQGLIHHQFVYRHLKTGAQIDLREYEAVDDSNADLVGGQ